MRILIFGAGVIGSLYGALLVEAGYDVSVYVACLLSLVICQKGYLMMTGVLAPTPISRYSTCRFSCLRRKSEYAADAFRHPASSTKVSSERRFIVTGSPFGAEGISSVGSCMEIVPFSGI